MEERRRFPRRPVEGDVASMPVAQQVRVVDISASGVLLHSTRPLHIGQTGALRFSLGGQPFAADVQVRRVTTAPTADGFRIGVKFLAVTPEHRQVIERFIAQ
jgi:c-di-GMP-binding flagellar brake protein YcgR